MRKTDTIMGDERRKRTLMKRLSILMLLICLCLSSVAVQAEQMGELYQAAAARIMPNLPDGMVATCTASDGRLNIVIDTHATDWDMVASSASKSESFALYPGIRKPEGMERAKSSGDFIREDGQSEGQFKEYVARALGDMRNGGGTEKACSQQGWAIGRYDAGTGLFIPEPVSSSAGAAFAACWIDAQGNTRNEYYMLTVTYSDYAPVYTRRQNVEKADMKGNVKAYGKVLPDSCVSSIETADGQIVYKLSKPEKGSEFFTAVAAPQWMNVDDDWSAFLLDRGNERKLDILDGAAYGLGNSCVLIPYKTEASNMLYKRDWSIKWVDGLGDVQGVYFLEARIYIDDPQLSISYRENMEPMPRSSIHWTTHNLFSGLGVEYDARPGILNLAIDEAKLPENRRTDFGRAGVSIEVDAPAGAVSYSAYLLRGDVIYGDAGGWLNDLGWRRIEPGKPVQLPELEYRPFFTRYTFKLPNGKMMNYYVKPLMVCDLGGESIVFEWLDARGRRIGKMQQITLTADQYQVVEQERRVLTNTPDRRVNIPTLQAKEAGLYAATAELPQQGDSVIRYEIALLDKNGSKVRPEGTVLVYLPYPDGKTMEEALYDTYEVYHELEDGSVELYSVENGKLTLTEYGLCMEVSSFSPYFLSWEEGTAPDVSKLPETGDSSNLTGYLMLFAVCAACVVLMSRKRAVR